MLKSLHIILYDEVGVRIRENIALAGNTKLMKYVAMCSLMNAALHNGKCEGHTPEYRVTLLDEEGAIVKETKSEGFVEPEARGIYG